MIRSIYTVNRNMNILQKKQENTSANISNVNTTGYKFQDIVQSTLETRDLINYTGGNKLNRRQELGGLELGNQIDGVYKNFDQGNLIETNKETDFSIVGNGFFTIQMDNGQIGYTRNGNFKVNEENQLITMEGHLVIGMDNNGNRTSIYVNNNGINVNGNGEILGQNTRFLITDFADYEGLESVGDTIFMGNQGYEALDSDIRQGFLESSNVKIVDEIVKMIEISREFESNQKILHAADETLSKAVNEIGRV